MAIFGQTVLSLAKKHGKTPRGNSFFVSTGIRFKFFLSTLKEGLIFIYRFEGGMDTTFELAIVKSVTE